MDNVSISLNVFCPHFCSKKKKNLSCHEITKGIIHKEKN